MFCYLITIYPLGLLYGSAGPFLSPENLVGRAGNRFPPSTATVSGLYAAQYGTPGTNKRQESVHHLALPDLILAGPFWAYSDDPQNFYVPTPFNYLVKLDPQDDDLDPQDDDTDIGQGEISERLTWCREQQQWEPLTPGKFDSDTWLPIQDWHQPSKVSQAPWRYLRHLHPRLEESQRRVAQSSEQGSLFLENSIQMHPDTCLVYLSNTELERGCYRFGGEGHLVDVECEPITNAELLKLFTKAVGNQFALITPGVWGSNRRSYRFPMTSTQKQQDTQQTQKAEYRPNCTETQETPSYPSEWENAIIFTERPTPFRYRLGGEPGKPKRLSRGRYAVPAGTVYVLENPISKPWFKWNESWFPREGYSYKRWGCGLALALP